MRPSRNTQPENSPGPGSPARTGRPGTAPRCEPVRSTEVSVPRTKPGPSRTETVHSTRLGMSTRHTPARPKLPQKPGPSEAHRSLARSMWSANRTMTRRRAGTSRATTPRQAAVTTIRTRASSVGHRASKLRLLMATPRAAPIAATRKPPIALLTTSVEKESVLVASDSSPARTPYVPAVTAT